MILTESDKVRAEIPLDSQQLISFLQLHDMPYDLDPTGVVWTSYQTLVRVRELLRD